MEPKVSETIQALVANAPDNALPYIIDILADSLQQRLKKIPGTIAWSLADRLGYELYYYGLTVQSPDTGSYWNRYSPQRSRQSFKLIWEKLGFDSWQGKRVLDLGAGEYVPAALSLIALSQGAEKAFAVDPCPPVNLQRSFASYEELVKDILYAPEQYQHSDYSFVQNNLFHSDTVKRVKNRAFDDHKSDDFTFFQLPVNQVPVVDNIDLVWAFSVLEHIDDLDEACQVLYRMTRTGGRHFYTIDFTDHRRYVDTSFGPWDFLCDSDYSEDQNRLRFNAVKKAFEQAGFSIVFYEPVVRQSVDQTIREKLLPEYRHISDEELSILNAHLVVEKR